MAMQAASSFVSSRSGDSTSDNTSHNAKVSTKKTISTSNNENVFVLTSEMERRAGIQTEKVERRLLSKSIVFSSSVESTSKGSAVVNSIVHGVITRVLADVGDNVKSGQALCYINCPDLAEAQSAYLAAVAKLQEAKAQITLVQNRVELGKAEVQRLQELNKEGIAATKDLQSSEVRLASTEAELAASRSLLSASHSYVASAESRLRAFGISSKDLSDAKIGTELALKSPISGTVIRKNVQPGENVNPAGMQSGTPEDALYMVVDLRKVWVMLEVPQAEVASLKIGAPVSFTSEVAPGKVFYGRVITAGQKFDAASRTVPVRVEINNSQDILKPGMLVLARADESVTAKSILCVKNSALQQIDNKQCVFCRLAPNRYKKQLVTPGTTNGEFTQILSGLKEGEEIVTNGSFILKSEALKADLEAHD
jgi:cobalt-zinc-cadmium efflux system membrane fusion protein